MLERYLEAFAMFAGCSAMWLCACAWAYFATQRGKLATSFAVTIFAEFVLNCCVVLFASLAWADFEDKTPAFADAAARGLACLVSVFCCVHLFFTIWAIESGNDK